VLTVTIVRVSAPSWDQVVREAAREKVTLRRSRLHGARGLWVPASRTIWVDSRLLDHHAAPTLAHELIHARRGDGECGPASSAERYIDQRVARRWINRDVYAVLEDMYAGDAWSIASELDLPRWLVVAFQDYLGNIR
jgi:hypothetical protein